MQTYEIIKEILTHGIMFLALLWILYYLLWDKFMNLLDERAAAVKAEFDKADDARTEYENLHAEYDKRMKEIEAAAHHRMNEEIAKANKVREEILAKAAEEAETLRKNAERSIHQEIANARVELKEELVNLTLQATGKLISVELNDEKHRKLVDEFLEKAGAA